MFIMPAVAVASKWLEDPLAHNLPVAGAIVAVLAGVSEHLTGDATRHAITSLKIQGNHDLEFILASSIGAALAESHRELSGGSQLLTEPFDEWFSLWQARLDRALKSSDDTALLFHADDSVDPVDFAAASVEIWWPRFRIVLVRWANEQRDFDSLPASETADLPERLDKFLSQRLLDFARRAQSLELRNEHNNRAWKAWQQRFFEALAEGLQELLLSAQRQEQLLKQQQELLKEIHAWLSEMRAARAASRPTGSAPPPPGLFIGRDEVVAELRQRLLPSMNKGNVQLVTAVRGWPGVGKTTVAAAMAHDQVLADAFPDGLLWASIGQKPDLIGQLDIWARELGGTLLERQKLSIASNEVASMLREKRMLLIIDDVWTDEAARPFMVGGVHCSTIITTRLTKVAEELGLKPKQVYCLDVLNEEQSLDLLKELAPEVVAKFFDQCRLLVQELEGLPLALHVAGRLIQSEWYRGFSVEQLLVDLRSAAVLRGKAPAMPDGSPSPTVSALFKKSTDVLSDELRYRFACLGWFAPKPATFSFRAMKDVWEVNDPSGIARQLIDHGLLEPAGPGRYQMHALLVLHAKSLLDD
jgi:hypothetical protein